MTSLKEAYAGYGNGGEGVMLHYEDEIRIQSGKVSRKEIEYELWYNKRWYITRIFGIFVCILPPSTGVWEDKYFFQKIFTNREVKKWRNPV